MLPDGEDIAVLQPFGKSLLSVSTSGRGAFVRLWSMTGGVTWDAHIPAVGTSGARSAPPAAIITGGAVVVVWQSTVRAFHATSGEQLWKSTPQEGSSLLALLTPAAPSTAATTTAGGASGGLVVPAVHVYGLSKDGDLITAVLEDSGERSSKGGAGGGTIDPKGGVRTLQRGYKGNGPLLVTLDRSHVAAIDATGTRLLLHEVGSSVFKTHEIPTLSERASGTTASLAADAALPSMLILKLTDGGSLLLRLAPKAAAPTLVETSASAAGAASHVFALTTSREGRAVLALATLAPPSSPSTPATALTFRTMQIDVDGSVEGDGSGGGGWSQSETLPYDEASLGPLRAGWLNSYTRKDGTFGHRLLLTADDHSLLLLQAGKDGSAVAGKPSWLRAEALASVRHSEMLPLPALEGDVDDDAPMPSFAFALPALLEGIQRRISEAQGGSASGGAATPDVTAHAHADAYGFRQVVISTTEAGKVFGLHSSDGSILWSRRIASPSSSSSSTPALPFNFICRGGGHPEAVVVAQSETAWRVDALSPYSGRLLHADDASLRLSGNGKIVHAARLDSLGAADGSTRPPVMLVDEKLNVHLYPPTSESRAAVDGVLGDLFFYLFDEATGRLTGYVVGKGGSGDSGLAGQPRWSMSLPPAAGSAAGEGKAATEGRSPVTLAPFPASSAVHSPVRVLGDRNVLHKYINRNLLAVGIEHAGDGEFEESSVQVMLVDTISGKILHSTRHREAKGPLSFVMGENWLVWHYWSPKSLTYQMAVAELFVNTTISDDPLRLLLGGAPDYSLRENQFDGYSHPPPHVLSQGYAFSAPVNTLAVTQTIAGITPKFVLVATTAGQLVLLDKRFLDPRRPIVPGGPQKMSAADREEGLVPYGPSLGGISPLSVVSHRHTVARPRSIVCGTTLLESTTLAIVHGVDLFMTRVAPAREFDRLNEDFNYPALVGAIILLVAATFATEWYSQRKDLARAWK